MARERNGERRNPDSTSINWERFSSSFFFCNFPNSCEVPDMWRAFSRYGKVLDVFIASKKTKKGSRFGFVRFKNCSDPSKLESALNQIWFGSYKLRVNKSKYQRNGAYSSKPIGVADKVVNYKGVSDIVAGKSFAEVTVGKATQVIRNGEKTDMKIEQPVIPSSSLQKRKVQLVSSENDWFSSCLVGELLNEDLAENIKDLLEAENFSLVSVKSFGGNRVLLECDSLSNKEKILSGVDWLNLWFKWIKAWGEEFSTVGRIARIKCFGVPVQSWSKESFMRIGRIWGEVIEVGKETVDKTCIEFGIFSVYTRIWDKISQILEVEIDGNLFEIKVCEESVNVDSRYHWSIPSVRQSRFSSSSADSIFSDSAANGELIGDDASSVFFDGEREPAAGHQGGCFSLNAKDRDGLNDSIRRQKDSAVDLQLCQRRLSVVSPREINEFEKASHVRLETKSQTVSADKQVGLDYVSDGGPCNYSGPLLDTKGNNGLAPSSIVKETELEPKMKSVKTRELKRLSDILEKLGNNITVNIEKPKKTQNKGKALRFGSGKGRSNKAGRKKVTSILLQGASVTDSGIYNMSRLQRTKEIKKLSPPDDYMEESKKTLMVGKELGIDFSKVNEDELIEDLIC